MAEALTILAIWLSKWRFAPVPGREVRFPEWSLCSPKGGLPCPRAPLISQFCYCE